MILALQLVVIPVFAETYTAAGLKFVASGSNITKIGSWSTSGMSFNGTGGLMLLNAFQNLDNNDTALKTQIEQVAATAVTSDTVETVMNKYFLSPSSGSNMYSFTSSIASSVNNIYNTLYFRLIEMQGYLKNIRDFIGNSSIYDSSGTSTIYNNIANMLSAWSKQTYDSGFYSGNVIDGSGTISTGKNVSVASLTARLGLEMQRNTWFTSAVNTSVNNMKTRMSMLLTGNDADSLATHSMQFFTDYQNGEYVQKQKTFTNVMDGFAVLGQEVQQRLFQLQSVLADDADMELKDATSDNQDSFKDNFTGSGGGSVSVSDISSAAGLTTGVKDSFAGAGNAGDAFLVISNQDSYSFFSQDVADALDTVNQAVLLSDDDEESDNNWMDNFQADEDGFYSLADPAAFDAGEFLKGLIK